MWCVQPIEVNTIKHKDMLCTKFEETAAVDFAVYAVANDDDDE